MIENWMDRRGGEEAICYKKDICYFAVIHFNAPVYILSITWYGQKIFCCINFKY